ncbi:MAG: SDR family oxidoreductase [Deltaproteobacteria bacterium]|jgi:short-subunit dehydrogenase|nr:SDR family oxidoreductase [Deltaproteobacteria bacterium]MDX9761009.1 SDR family oxidoreductase [Desulfomonilia bacterium]HPW68247.1 SDR family oxidoreductase [Deltaproteobacteria bacterium]
MKNTDRVVWITGASSGIGEALAYAYSEKGARLILSSRNEARLREVRDRCAEPGSHLVVPLDLRDTPCVGAGCAEVLKHMGHVDILINNGGVSQRSLAMETPLDIDRMIMETNFFGTVTLTKAVLPSMAQQRSGRIVVISSLVGRFGTPLRSAYSASKHALHGFFESLRAEVWGLGIGVTLVCPGFIRTNISVNALTGDGSPQGTMDEAQAHGMPPDACARKIIAAVEKGKPEVYIGGRELMGVYIKKFAPGLFDRIIRKARVT